VRVREKVRRRFRRAPDTRKLRDLMRLDVHLPARLHDRRIYRIVPATRTERGERTLVIIDRVAEIVLRKCRVSKC